MNEGLLPLMILALLFSLIGGSVVARRPEQHTTGLLTMLAFQLLGSAALHLEPAGGLYALLAVHLSVIACHAICAPAPHPQAEAL